MKEKGLKITSGIDLNELKDYFSRHYGYIYFDYEDVQIVQYLNQNYVAKIGNNIPVVCNLLADHLLANGAFAQE